MRWNLSSVLLRFMRWSSMNLFWSAGVYKHGSVVVFTYVFQYFVVSIPIRSRLRSHRFFVCLYDSVRWSISLDVYLCALFVSVFLCSFLVCSNLCSTCRGHDTSKKIIFSLEVKICLDISNPKTIFQGHCFCICILLFRFPKVRKISGDEEGKTMDIKSNIPEYRSILWYFSYSLLFFWFLRDPWQ